MVFSKTTTPYDGLIQGCERETKLGLGTISGNASPNYYLAEFLVSINNWNNRVNQWIQEVDDEWTHQDTNETGDNPEVKDFTDNTQSYTLDTDIVKIRRVQAHNIISATKTVTITIATPAVISLTNHGLIASDVLRFSTTDTLPTGLSIDTDYYVISTGLTDDVFRVSTSDGGSAVATTGTQAGTQTIIINKIGWYDLDLYLEKDRIEDLYGQKSEAPVKYFIQGRSLITDIPVDIAKVDKYRITQDRHAHAFVIGDTTAEPGFDSDYHEILYWGATMDWASGKHKDIYNKAYLKIFGQGENDPNALKSMLQEHYLKQNHKRKSRAGRKSVSYI